jgi:hypothetical protein
LRIREVLVNQNGLLRKQIKEFKREFKRGFKREQDEEFDNDIDKQRARK